MIVYENGLEFNSFTCANTIRLMWGPPFCVLKSLSLEVLHSSLTGSCRFLDGPSSCGFTVGCGNTQVACHVGMSSRGQRHCNVCIVYLLTCTITNTIVKSFPCLASMHFVSGLITPTLWTPLQDHLSTHKREMQHNYDYVALYPNKDPWLGTANPIDIRCKFSCDGEFIMLEEHLQGKLLPHPFLYILFHLHPIPFLCTS